MPRKSKRDETAAIEVVAELVVNPLTGTPTRSQSGAYHPRYCELVLKMFAEMLESSGVKLADTEVEETREIAERTPPEKRPEDPAADPSKPGPKPGRPGMVIQEKRKVKRKEWKLVCAELPSFAKFGRLVGVSSGILKQWRAQYPSFDEACNMAADMAGDALFQRGLRGQYDAEMVKFVGKNWFGFVDRHELTGAEGAPLNPPAEYRGITVEALDEARTALLDLRTRLLAGTTTTQTGELSKT